MADEKLREFLLPFRDKSLRNEGTMANLSEYKCPACGAPMEFDSQSQKMKCPYCETTMSVAEYTEQMKEQDKEAEETAQTGANSVGNASVGKETSGKAEQAGNDGLEYWQDSETAGMRVYGCESCGGEIIASETIGAMTCPYCGNNVVMKGQFSGDLKPNFIIPFKKNKKQAKEAYYKHLEKKYFLPSVFKDENHIDEIKGVYVPFWLYDAEASGDMTYAATRVHTRKTETPATITTYTTTDYFQLTRSGVAKFSKVPADGSSKMDDDLMDSVEPFDFHDLVPFTPAYMAGYLAERYDVSKEDSLTRAKERIKSSAEAAFYNTTTGYSSVVPEGNHLNIRASKINYVLLPVWILNTTWEGQQFIFAMNGQTGKIVGNLPCDKKSYWKYVGTRGLIASAIIMALLCANLFIKLL